jgi:hypothetical protein
MDLYNVLTVTPKGSQKSLSVKGRSRKQFTIQVPRFASVGPGDRITLTGTSPEKICVVSKEDPNDLLPVCPPYRIPSKVVLGTFELDAFCTEVIDQEHLDDLSYLEQFHYKTSFFLSDGDEETASSSKLRPISTGGAGESYFCSTSSRVRAPRLRAILIFKCPS